MADGRKGNVKFIVDKREVVEDAVRLSVRMLNSTLAQPTTNELPIIFNALAASRITSVEPNDGFTYSFPLPLS